MKLERKIKLYPQEFSGPFVAVKKDAQAKLPPELRIVDMDLLNKTFAADEPAAYVVVTCEYVNERWKRNAARKHRAAALGGCLR